MLHLAVRLPARFLFVSNCLFGEEVCLCFKNQREGKEESSLKASNDVNKILYSESDREWVERVIMTGFKWIFKLGNHGWAKKVGAWAQANGIKRSRTRSLNGF